MMEGGRSQEEKKEMTINCWKLEAKGTDCTFGNSGDDDESETCNGIKS